MWEQRQMCWCIRVLCPTSGMVHQPNSSPVPVPVDDYCNDQEAFYALAYFMLSSPIIETAKTKTNKKEFQTIRHGHVWNCAGMSFNAHCWWIVAVSGDAKAQWNWFIYLKDYLKSNKYLHRCFYRTNDLKFYLC